MSSVDEIRKEIIDLKNLYKLTKNENSKLAYKKKIDDLNKELKKAKATKKVVENKPVEKPHPEQPQEPKKDQEPPKKENVNDINRGKVAEPGSNIPDNKHEDKREDNNNKKSNRN